MENKKVIFLVIFFTLFLPGCLTKLQQVILSPSIVEEALNYALTVDGFPYVLGGRGPNEFDCSGLIVWSYKQAYPEISFRVGRKKVSDIAMNDIWRYNTVPLLPTDMQSGDIVFITDSDTVMTHGGMFIEWVDETTFKFINASSYYGKVVIDTWSTSSVIRGQWFAGAGRLQTVRGCLL